MAKRVQDRCHGEIKLEPLLVRVMDTREFQRLRGLQQLGGSAFVFPDASHSRFEHSLGVAHLARLMVRHLQRHELGDSGIDERDVTCVSLAGLVHDLGHGPFSHMFEEFVNEHRPDKFSHEDMSCVILRHLLAANGIRLRDYMCTSAEEEAQDLAFVELLIRGLDPCAAFPVDSVGRSEDKRFLFEIVSNKNNGVDVHAHHIARGHIGYFI
jgi:HD superfamily phosphohydrolase